MAGKIFVNYRRDDSAPYALNVAQYMEREFGAQNVFLDIDRLRPGQKFPKVLEQRLTDSRIMLAVIGPAWLHATNENGLRRLDDPDDWVRLEITRALARDIPVIPVLVGGATVPPKSALPDDLKPLVEHQVATVTTNGFRTEMAGLARDIREVIGPRRRWPLAAGAIAAAATIAIGLIAYLGLIPVPNGNAPDDVKTAAVQGALDRADVIHVPEPVTEPEPAPKEWTQRIAGEYQGYVVSSGKRASALTTFSADGKSGRFQYRNNDSREDRMASVVGTLDDCRPLKELVLKCIWKAEWRSGNMTVTFDDTLASFDGSWVSASNTRYNQWTGSRN